MPLQLRNTKQDKPPPLRMILYGKIKVGKSTMAATCPKPFFISIGQEQGVSSLQSPPPTHELPNGVDYVFASTPEEVREGAKLFEAECAKPEPRWRTCVLDTISVLSRFLQMKESAYGQVPIEQHKWNKILGVFLNIRDILHNTNGHVVWVCHEEEERDGRDGPIIRVAPKISGQAYKEIAGTCGLIARLTAEEVTKEVEETNEKGEVVGKKTVQETQRALFTKCFTSIKPRYEAGSWYEGALHEGWYVPHFNALAKRLAPVDGPQLITL